ncbi:hypothetical protein D3C72_1933640 [compost metagenome]
MGIGQCLVVGLVAGRQPLFQRQALVLHCLLCCGAYHSQLVEGVSVQPGLFCELCDVAPVLELPGTHGAEQN